MIRFILIFLMLFNMSFAFQIRFGDRQQEYRIVIQGNEDTNFDIFQIERTIIVKVNEPLENNRLNIPPFVSSLEIYQTQYDKKTLIYIEISDNRLIKTFTLSNPKRLVIDIEKNQKYTISKPKEDKKSYSIDYTDLNKILSSIQQEKEEDIYIDVDYYKNYKGKKRIVVIDPGHGGQDPGAIAHGLQEKDINLKVAKILKSYFDKDPRFIAYLTRDKDIFVPLYDRTLIALEKNADLFISIHTNASENQNLNGTYVYTLNLKGATSKLARMVEERENKTVLNVIKVSTNPNVNKIVADMAISHTMTEGLNFAKFIEVNFRNMVRDIEFKRIESANFAVLKTPSIPAILFETAFITNERDAQLLKDDRFLEKIAKSLYKSTSDYFFRYKNLVFSESR